MTADRAVATGFAAMGKPVPFARRQRAYDAAVSMGVKDAFSLIDGMAEKLQRDKPYEAMEMAYKYVDLTGAYRLMATLLT